MMSRTTVTTKVLSDQLTLMEVQVVSGVLVDQIMVILRRT
jgi:hypothetical protein